MRSKLDVTWQYLDQSWVFDGNWDQSWVFDRNGDPIWAFDRNWFCWWQPDKKISIYYKLILSIPNEHVTRTRKKCEFHEESVDSICKLRSPFAVADLATAQFYYTHVLLFFWGFHKLFRVRQIPLRLSQNHIFWSFFERFNVSAIQFRKLACCGEIYKKHFLA